MSIRAFMDYNDAGGVVVMVVTIIFAVFALAIGIYLVAALAPSIGQISGGLVETLFVVGTLVMIFAIVIAYVLGRGGSGGGNFV